MDGAGEVADVERIETLVDAAWRLGELARGVDYNEPRPERRDKVQSDDTDADSEGEFESGGEGASARAAAAPQEASGSSVDNSE